MQLFFSSRFELEHYTHYLQVLPDDHACQYCEQNDHWVSHGYVYKQCSIDQREVVGKRILCSNRFQHLGCGRTRQLYLHDALPGRRYSLHALVAFILNLLNGLSVSRAYQCATHVHSSRHAWRWLNDLFAQLSHFRTRLCRLAPGEPSAAVFPLPPDRRLRILLPTLQHFRKHFSLMDIQCHQQQAFF